MTSTPPKDKYLLGPQSLYFLLFCFMYAPASIKQSTSRRPGTSHPRITGTWTLSQSFRSSLTGLSGPADRYRAHKQVLMIKSLLRLELLYHGSSNLHDFTGQFKFEMAVATVSSPLPFSVQPFPPARHTLVFSILENSPSLKVAIPTQTAARRQSCSGPSDWDSFTPLNGTLTDFIGYRAQFWSSRLLAFYSFPLPTTASTGLKTVSVNVSKLEITEKEIDTVDTVKL